MKKIAYIIGFIALALLASCENETENIALSETAASVNGQWEVTAYNDTTAVSGIFKLITLLDSSGNDSITIQDSGEKFWDFQVGAALNSKEGTFQTKLSESEICEKGVGVKIANGKIMQSDSIYFEIQFEDDITPFGITYQIKGQRVGN